MQDDVSGRLARAAHLVAILLAAVLVSIPALRALPALLGTVEPTGWTALAPALASALALVLVPVFLATPGRVTALLTYAAVGALPSVVAAASGPTPGPLDALAFALPCLLLGGLLGGWGVVARRDAQRALVL